MKYKFLILTRSDIQKSLLYFYMKALWLVSFRPIGKSKINDFIQSVFVDSINSINFDITFSLTQFDEVNVKEFVEEKKIKKFYNNISKDNLPEGKKYSNKLMLKNALDQYVESDFEYLIFSSADIIVPNNLFEVLSKIKMSNFCAFIYPNTHITNGVIKNNYWPHYGIDLIVLKISKEKAVKFREIIESYEQYDWGIIENFYFAASEVLELTKINLFKNLSVLKFNNDYETFNDDRKFQEKSWKENQKYFVKFLKKNNLSSLYAYGSYYYLLYKIFNFKDLNLNLLLSYLIFYPYYLSKKILDKLK